MKLSHVEVSGFRGFKERLRIDFGDAFTIIDGRNGAGKSTILDAVEFALTGDISKYQHARAAGESVMDYVWWRGDGAAPSRYVEVGFVTPEGRMLSLRRAADGAVSDGVLKDVVEALCDLTTAPPTPLVQLCAAAIIRDEQITTLSLDLKEFDRYALLRQALGASDAEDWIDRANKVAVLARRQSETAERTVNELNNVVASTGRQLDQTRASIASDKVLAESAARLRDLLAVSVPVEELPLVARERVVELARRIEELRHLRRQFDEKAAALARIQENTQRFAMLSDEAARLAADVAAMPVFKRDPSVEPIASQLSRLVQLGNEIGLIDHACPLCRSALSDEGFAAGRSQALEMARAFSATAAAEAESEQLRMVSERRLGESRRELSLVQERLRDDEEIVRAIDVAFEKLGLTSDGDPEAALKLASELEERQRRISAELPVVETVRLSTSLANAQRAVDEATDRLRRAQEVFGEARRTLRNAAAIHDAARRAASEVLDRRLERVLPLLVELYRRLRPHMVWNDIDYSIRGDVRRFLKLNVGDELNPQFLFSSGQRRATGIAFLLSVNLSLAWSKWRTILLDDPVQHVDDFRAVHLAELLAKMVADGRQLVCCVEDAALAELLCRRLPVSDVGSAKRVTLSARADGVQSKILEAVVPPLPRRSLTTAVLGQAAS